MGEDRDALRPEDQQEDVDWVVELERTAWHDRPFARSFDLISNNYGWTDDQILDLTLQRMRQIREVIFERRAEARRLDLRDKESELRILASYMAQNKKAAKQAEKITLLKAPKGKAVVPSFERAVGLFGTDTTAPEVVD